ncbi:MAG: sucrase ferredoxin [Myxococcota bacterium]
MSDTCCEASRIHHEPIEGSAAESTSVWIVLEYREAWGAKALPESTLSDAVKQHLMSWEKALQGSRIQFVRHTGRCEGPLHFWLGTSGLDGARIFEWIVPQADALLEFDAPAIIEAIRRGQTPEGAQAVERPMVLVCTNGRRDVCCSVEGIPVAKAFERQEGVEVWHTTHLGGHRFAATLLELPRGLCYGRVSADEVPALAEAIVAGRIDRLDRLRGRTALSCPEQAAETFWRREHGLVDSDALASVEHVESDGQVVVTLSDQQGQRFEVRVERRELGGQAPPSCGKPPRPVAGWFPVA